MLLFMRRTHSWVVVLSLAGLVAVACGGGGEAGEEAFEIPSNAEEIGSTGLYLPRAEPATLPRPTSGASTPRIMGVTATRTGPYSFSVHVDVESTATIAYAYLDFGEDGVFKVPTTAVTTGSSSTDPPLTACGVAAKNQGITCTSACLAACSCLSCSDDSVELNAEQACALNCSIYDDLGALEGEPYDGSEQKFASILYNGDSSIGLPGVASQLGCGTSACISASISSPRKSWAVEFQTPTVPEVTPLFATQVVTEGSAQVSAPAAAARVAVGNVCSKSNELDLTSKAMRTPCR